MTSGIFLILGLGTGIRGEKNHIDARIIQSMIAGIPLLVGLGTGM